MPLSEACPPLSARKASKFELPNAKSISVAVTGGCGFLGSAVVRHLVDAGYNVVVLDVKDPEIIKNEWKDKVRFFKVDICYGNADDLGQLLRENNVAAMVHVAGTVCLADNEPQCHNLNFVATQKVMRASRLSNINAFLFTSSTSAVTSPYAEFAQKSVPSEFKPSRHFPFASHYSRTKFEAEKLVLQANEPGFATCALRFPGLYGLGDNMIVDPILAGLVKSVPTGDDVHIDFCYVENAAHSHKCALSTLYDRGKSASVGGRTFNVTNGEPARDAIDTWSELLSICFPGSPKLSRSPKFLWVTLAMLSEFIFGLLDGNVPAPRNTFWNLTRTSVEFASTTITLDISETLSELGYKPLYTYRESFQHIKEQYAKCSQSMS